MDGKSQPRSDSTATPEGRLDSWKEIAGYLRRGTRTVQRWEREEGLPVHRLQHEKLGSVYAYRSELDSWWDGRKSGLANEPAEPEPQRSLAVLPFADMSREKDQGYLCEGVAEEIIAALSRVRGLRVASRTASFPLRAPGVDVREIGRRLRVSTLLEGSVQKSGERLRIGVRLTDAESGFQIWAERYDREMNDIFAVQDEIAGSVAGALEVSLSQSERTALRKAPAADARAYDCYLRGRQFYYQYSPRGVEFALQMFIQAIGIDPGYARAYAGLADCWSYLYLYSQRDEVVRSQADWASLKAIELDPDSAQAQASRGLSLSLAGRNQEAEQAFGASQRLDPELFEAYYFHARHCFALGRLEEAAALYEEAMRVRPEDYQSPLLIAQSLEALGRAAEAAEARKQGVQRAERHLRLNPDDARALYMGANGLVALGDRSQGRWWAERALALAPEDPMTLYNVGCIFSMLGAIEEAITCLQKAVAGGLKQRGWYEHDTNLDPLRDDARFQALLRQLE